MAENTTENAKDSLVHIQVGNGQFAPCGVRVSSLSITFENGKVTRHATPPEPLHTQCGDDLSRATCPYCKSAIAKMCRLYRKATRGKLKWQETLR